MKTEVLRGMEQLVDGAAESIDRNRFVQDDIDGLRFGAGHFDERAKTGQHDDGNVLIQLLDEARGLLAAHLRHDAVDYNEIERLPAEFLESFAATGGGGHLVSIATKIRADDFTNPGLIIDNE